MKARRQLSLMEIIVVVIILGLLIAALIPGPAAKQEALAHAGQLHWIVTRASCPPPAPKALRICCFYDGRIDLRTESQPNAIALLAHASGRWFVIIGCQGVA